MRRILQLAVGASLLTTSTQAYVVQPGDTLYGLARRTGASVAELQHLNALTDTSLKVGQYLALPGEAHLASQAAVTASSPSVPPMTCTCGVPVSAPPPPLPLPPIVTGKVAFYAAIYDSTTLRAIKAYALGPTNEVLPLASAYKTAVLWATLRDIDNGKLKLTTPLTTTEANRSIEFYSAGTNSVLKLARAALQESENTASDILHRTVGTERLAKLIHRLSPCTQVLLTNKALWGAQAGLFPDLIPSTNPTTMLSAARTYQQLPFLDRISFANKLNTRSLEITGPKVEKLLDIYFKGPNYHPELDTAFHNVSTARALTDLTITFHRKSGLSPQMQQVMRGILSKGCCLLKNAPFKYTYWGAKAGSGWRLLTLTGYVELPNSKIMAYTYLNHESNTYESEVIERQIWPVVRWISAVLAQLSS
jgi:beta-lactamase class A